MSFDILVIDEASQSLARRATVAREVEEFSAPSAMGLKVPSVCFGATSRP